MILKNKRRVFLAKHLRRGIFRVQILNMTLTNQTPMHNFFPRGVATVLLAGNCMFKVKSRITTVANLYLKH